MQSGPKNSAIFPGRTGYPRRISPTSVSVRIGRDLLISTLPFEDRLRPARRRHHYTRRLPGRPHVEDVERGGTEGDRFPPPAPGLPGGRGDPPPHPHHPSLHPPH